MEVGLPISHDVEGDMGNGQMNSKWVMLYVHHGIANNGEKSLWHLPTCRDTVDKRTGPTRYAKGLASTQKIAARQKARAEGRAKDKMSALHRLLLWGLYLFCLVHVWFSERSCRQCLLFVLIFYYVLAPFSSMYSLISNEEL
jgi:hypothetical protein